MLGISLVFVGITLIINGLTPLLGVKKDCIAIFNLLTGLLIIIYNVYTSIITSEPSKFIDSFGGMLFGFTNLIIYANLRSECSEKPFGIYCFFSAVCAVILGIYYIYSSKLFLGGLWFIWSLIWIFAFVSNFAYQKFAVATQYMFIIQGVLSTFTIGLLLLTQIITI